MFLVSPGHALHQSPEACRQKDSDCEDGEHAPYQSQKSSIDSSGSSHLVGPQSLPLMPNALPESVPSRKEIPRENVPQQDDSTEGSGDSQLPCTTPNGAVVVQCINVQANNCDLSFTGIAESEVQQGRQLQGLVQTSGQVAEFSCEFGEVTDQIMTAVKEEKKEGLLLSIAAEMTSPDPNDSLFPGAAEAKTIEEFFQLGRKKKWWHWLDFDRILLILERSKCTRALEIIKPYMKKLGDHVTDRLSVLNKNTPCDEGPWLEMKCQCDSANLMLQSIKEHKLFLISRLKVPNLAFTYCDAYEGCMLTLWKIHSPMQAADIKKKLLSMEGCSKVVEPGREGFKATIYTPFTGKTISTACL